MAKTHVESLNRSQVKSRFCDGVNKLTVRGVYNS